MKTSLRFGDFTDNRIYILLIVVLIFIGSAFGWPGSNLAGYLSKSDEWYRSEEGRRRADNIVSWQDEHGSWPKNMNTSSEPFSGDRKEIQGTFDNRATTGEMRFLARAFLATGEQRYENAFLKAVDLILKAQYPTGGWPQYYPPSKAYHRYITFNDNSMVRIMVLLDEIAKSPMYSFVDAERRAVAKKAFDRGIECILKCQIKVDGKLTVWCAQHDEVDCSPRKARSYELASLSGGESSEILKLLMSLENPSQRIIEAIEAGVKWYESSKVTGIRIKWIDGKRTAVKEPKAPVLWARFYEIETNRPLFCNRDGIPLYDYNQLDKERTAGYAWYGEWGEDVLEDYKKWKVRWEHLFADADAKLLVIIGDSTVCKYPENDSRRGWGQYIQDYFTDKVKVVNHARSGRSSKTFIEQGLWEKTLSIKPDYVLIQFGHNDSHDPDRPESTGANADYPYYLRQYIDESRLIGAVPVLVTPMHRRKFNSDGTLKDILKPYADAMKKVAEEKKVAVVDLHTTSGKLFQMLGDAGSMEMANAADDRTHFNERGAKAMASLVMQELPYVELSLKKYLKKESN